MEEILASIRRIIADDQESIQEASRAEQINDLSPLRNVLDLAGRHVPSMAGTPECDRDEADAKPESDWQDERFTPDFASIYGTDIGSSAPSAAKGQAASKRLAEPSRPEGLLSREADASVSDAFGRLAASMAPSNPKTMEDIVKEMLRPMLKAWLDDNLPPLVERLVQAEIDRLSRSGR